MNARWPTTRGRLLDNWGLGIVLLAYACLRLALVNSIPLNSDEPQHAHVVWAWSQGLVPYRDVFDNHAPLFHMLYAPLLRAMGETSYVLTWLRIAIIPVAVAALAMVAFIGRRLWGGRVALWALLLICACPPYLREAGTFRTDALWAMVWIATVACATSGRWTVRRAFWFGLLLGTSFAVSMKTSLLAAGLAIAWVFVAASLPRHHRPSPTTCLRSLGAVLGGAAIVPLLIVGWVALRGGLLAMHYGVVAHNMLPGLGRTHGAHWRMPLMLLLLGVLALLVRRAVHSADDAPLSARRAIVVASAVAYMLLLFGTWPLLSRQDMLPSIPLLALGLAGWWQTNSRPSFAWLPLPLAIAGFALMLHRNPPSRDLLAQQRATLADVLATTSDRDFVMDDKGASIYRMRPFYFALEGITRARIERGLIVDDIPQRLVTTKTYVVWLGWLPVKDAQFVSATYLPVRNGLMVAGHDFGLLGDNVTAPAHILLPGSYALATGSGSDPYSARLDGSAYVEPRWLPAGPHALTVPRSGRYALVWQPAARLLPWTGEQ